MSEEIIEGKSALQSIKDAVSCAKDKQYKKALKEIYYLFKNLYIKYLKDQYIEFKGKRIPRTAVFVAVVLLLFLILPGGNNQKVLPISNAEKAAQTNNLYDKDGIKIYDLVKCDQAACGFLENGTQKSFEKITVFLDFHDARGNVVYEGGINASEIGAMSRIKIKIPSEVEFSYFELKDVELTEKQPE